MEASRHTLSSRRLPRVCLEYDSEADTRGARELPFVLGVMADLSGTPAEPLPPVEARQFTAVDVDNFEAVLKAAKPRVVFTVPNTLTGEGSLSVDLTFESLEDFSPGALAHRADGLKSLYAAREKIKALLDKARCAGDLERVLQPILDEQPWLRELTRTERPAKSPPGPAPESGHAGITSLLSGAVGRQHDGQPTATKAAVDQLAALAVSGPGLVVAEDARQTGYAWISEIDRRLAGQVNLIIHQEDFQALEAAWRGLHYLITHVETNEMLQIEVLDISKRELSRSLRRFAGAAWERSPLFRSVHDQAFRVPDGVPFGCLIGDYAFDHSPEDVDTLGRIGQIAAAAQTPFLSGAAPSLLDLDSWQELGEVRYGTQRFGDVTHLPWQALRDTEEARFIGLTLPRFLGRRPYGAETAPVEEFAFEEEQELRSNSALPWCNAAYAMAANIARAFALYGWCANIQGTEAGGRVSDLPLRALPMADGLEHRLCPTEVPVDERRGSELERHGLIVLYHCRNTPDAVFFGAQSLQKPRRYEGSGASEANEAANLSARLPWLFPCCRFTHYVRCLARDAVGRWHQREDLERLLQDWLDSYVLPNPEDANEELKARKPLAAARIEIRPVEGEPGRYVGVLRLRPHFQLEPSGATLRTIFPLP